MLLNYRNLCHCVRSLNLLIQLIEYYDVGTSYIWRSSQRQSDSSLINYKYMAGIRMCETLATQTSPTLGINNYVFGITCFMYSDVCLWYIVREMKCTVICVWGIGWGKCCVQWCMSEVQGEGNVVYSDVCLRYRVREMLCTVMFVWGTGWEKIYCSTLGSRIWVTVWVSVKGFAVQLLTLRRL